MKTDDDLDKLFSSDVSSNLKQQKYEPPTPTELKTKRLIILQRLDDHIYSNTKAEITSEITKENTWIDEDNTEDIFKFPQSNTIKISFQQTITAKEAQTTELLIFFKSVLHIQIKEEMFISIITWMRC